jgi:hypothetical protein
MKKELLILLCFLLLSNNIYSQAPQGYFKYLDPLPNARYVNKQATIIIKPKETINKESLYYKSAISLTGTMSGICSFQIIRSDDNSTIILQPSRPFNLGEKVTVKFNSIIKTSKGENIKSFSYDFDIQPSEVFVTKHYGLELELQSVENTDYYNNDIINGFPTISLKYYNNPAMGQIFMSNFSTLGPGTPYLIILNNNTEPFYSIQMPAPCFDFNVQPNGNMTYFDGVHEKYFERDTNYNIVDSFYCGNGYPTDLHESRVLANRHAYLMAYDS